MINTSDYIYLRRNMNARADLRARLLVKGSYNLPITGPSAELNGHGGIIFPFTPNITVSHQVEYSSYDLVHSNYQPNAYARTRNPQIQISAQFASQTPQEAEYVVGVMHFLRVVSKMHFGEFDNDRGTPPPVLSFSAYGKYNFYNVPVLVGSFTFTYDDTVDYVETPSGNQVPSLTTIAIDLLTQYSHAKQASFSLNSLASGSGYLSGFL